MRIDPKETLESIRKDTANKGIVPVFWDNMYSDNILVGKRNKVTTLVIPVQMPTFPQSTYRIKIIGDGKILDERKGESDSWLRNNYNAMATQCGKNGDDGTWGDGYLNAKNTAGTLYSGDSVIEQRMSSSLENYSYGYIAAAENDDWGILVGTDDTAVDWEDDYSLGTKVVHGTGSGQLYHATSYIPASKAWDSGSLTFTHRLTRFLDNFSGSTITLKEMGQVGHMRVGYGVGGALVYVLVARDLITPVLDIPDKAQAAITYVYDFVYNKTGNILRNYFNNRFSQGAAVNGNSNTTFGDGYLSFKTTAGSISGLNYSLAWSSGNLDIAGNGFMGAAGADDRGMVVGTDDTAVTFNNYQLNSSIDHGTGTGELQYSVSETPIRIWYSATDIMTIKHARTFTNGSGASITVKESGLIGRMSTSVPLNCLNLHHTFTPQTVADTESLRIVYLLNTQYPT